MIKTQEYYYRTKDGDLSGSIFLQTGLSDTEVAENVAQQFGIEARFLQISTEEPALPPIRHKVLLDNLFNRLFSLSGAGVDAATWSLQGDLAQKIVADPKDKKAVQLLTLLLTEKEKADAKNDQEAVRTLVKKILQKREDYTTRMLQLNGLRRQADVEFSSSETEKEFVAVYDKYVELLVNLETKG